MRHDGQDDGIRLAVDFSPDSNSETGLGSSYDVPSYDFAAPFGWPRTLCEVGVFLSRWQTSDSTGLSSAASGNVCNVRRCPWFSGRRPIPCIKVERYGRRPDANLNAPNAESVARAVCGLLRIAMVLSKSDQGADQK
ncbi:hypothetical protein [Streptomyces chartreusis]